MTGSQVEAAMLVCLDAFEPVSANRTSGASPGWRAAAGLVLSHARASGWPVAHLLRRRPGPGEGGWRPSPGLEPHPSEPVFHRELPSAFRSQAFAEAAADAPASRLVLVGRSTDGAVLATLLEGVRTGLRVILPMDAITTTAGEHSGIDALAAIARRLPEIRLTLTTASALLGGACAFRVIEGGRALAGGVSSQGLGV